MNVTDPEKLALLYERFRDVCLVEKEVWYEIFLPRETKGMVLTNIQDRYEVVIEDKAVEAALEAAIPYGKQALDAAVQQYRGQIRFRKP
jgi:hypothetical protein